jgi:serine/threonine-protein kinase
MLCQQGGAVDVVKVLDFGLVKEVRAGDDVKLTGTNVVVGTPQYMAPESIVGGDAVDARADLYSLAATAYFLLTGHDMFAGDTVVEICGHHLHTTPEPPSKMVDGVPPDLDAVIMRCLEKLPDDRPRDARELMHLLAACAGRWTNDDAAAWWQRHNSELTTHSDTDVATARTVAATS